MTIGTLSSRFSHTVYLYGVSALDYYFHNFRRKHISLLHLVYTGSLADLSKDVDNLSFPGLDGVDAQATIDGIEYQFLLLDHDPVQTIPRGLAPFNLLYEPGTKTYTDLDSAYGAMKSREMLGMDGWLNAGSHNPHHCWEGAVYAARFPLNPNTREHIQNLEKQPPEIWQKLEIPFIRRSLNLILTGRWAHQGLELLHRTGAIAYLWPHIAAMDRTSQSKECHPEGNVWEHSLETLKHRKNYSLVLGLSLFLHDCGKPKAQRNKNRLFDGHAEIGAALARDILENLEYPSQIIEDVCWLVQSHMLPSGLKTLPSYRTEPYLAHELFPTLLELYRCDLASTWRDLGDYHHACGVYKGFQRYRKNPYRESDGKKTTRKHLLNHLLNID